MKSKESSARCRETKRLLTLASATVPQPQRGGMFIEPAPEMKKLRRSGMELGVSPLQGFFISLGLLAINMPLLRSFQNSRAAARPMLAGINPVEDPKRIPPQSPRLR